MAVGTVGIAAPAQANPAAPAAPAGPADAMTAPDPATAAAIAQRYHHAVGDLSSLTETTSVAAQPDGTQQLTISTDPVRVRRGGGWADVSTALVSAADGMLAPSASAVPVEFSKGGAGPLARVQTPAGSWVTVTSPVATLPAAVVGGSSVTYPEVLPGVDLRMTATVSGMSEVLVVKSAAAATDPRLASLPFGISGARVTADKPDSAATATAPDGSVVVSPSPTWWDAAQGGTADRPGGAGLTRPVQASVSASGVSLDAAAAAQTQGATYPVYVDPDWTGGTQAWTFVDSRYPTSSYWMGSNHGTDNEAHVGFIDSAHCGCSDGNHLDRTFWQLNTSGIAGKHVITAHFNTTELYSDACTSNVYQLNIMGGIGTGTTWAAQPRWYSTAARATFGPQRSGCATTTGVGIDATSVALSAASQRAGYMTVNMQADTEGDWTSWRRFAHGATMTVTYNTPPNTPSAPWDAGSPCSTTAPGKILTSSAVSRVSLGVTSSDPDGGNVQTFFSVAHRDGSNALDPAVYPQGRINGAMQAAGPNNVQILSNLPDGAYQWDSWAYDGIDSSPSSQMCYFQIHNAAPLPPVVTPDTPTSTTLTAGTLLNVSLGDGGAGDGVVGFAYTWQATDGKAPVYSSLPSCSNDLESGGIHFACGSSTGKLPVAPETEPQATLTVWAYNAAATPSPATTLTWTTLGPDATALSAKAHQWITDAGGPALASCPSGTATVTCVADNNLTGSSTGPAGQYPVPLAAGVTWDGSGNPTGVAQAPAGVLTFGSSSTTPMISDPAAVVDTTQSFTVGAWLTPTAPVTGYETAVSERGTYYSGFYLQINSNHQWQFVVSSTQNIASATSAAAAMAGTVGYGQPVYVAGVYDLVNHEVRLYVGGSLAGVSTYWPDSEPSANLGVALGSAWWQGAVVDHWSGQIGNPVVVPAALTSTQITQLQANGFFPPSGN